MKFKLVWKIGTQEQMRRYFCSLERMNKFANSLVRDATLQGMDCPCRIEYFEMKQGSYKRYRNLERVMGPDA